MLKQIWKGFNSRDQSQGTVQVHGQAVRGCRELETNSAAASLGQELTAPGWAEMGA